MRLIDADVLKTNCRITGEFMNNFECVSLTTLGEIIDKQPTIDPVNHGKWVRGFDWQENYSIYHCSECGGEPYYESDIVEEYKYCPYCGAKMDGDE